MIFSQVFVNILRVFILIFYLATSSDELIYVYSITSSVLQLPLRFLALKIGL